MTKTEKQPKNKWILKLKKKDRELYGLGKKVMNEEFEDWVFSDRHELYPLDMFQSQNWSGFNSLCAGNQSLDQANELFLQYHRRVKCHQRNLLPFHPKNRMYNLMDPRNLDRNIIAAYTNGLDYDKYNMPYVSRLCLSVANAAICLMRSRSSEKKYNNFPEFVLSFIYDPKEDYICTMFLNTPVVSLIGLISFYLLTHTPIPQPVPGRKIIHLGGIWKKVSSLDCVDDDI